MGNRVLLVTSRLNKIAVRDSTADKGRLVSLVPLDRLCHISTRGNSLEGLDRVDEGRIRESPWWLSWPPVMNLEGWPISWIGRQDSSLPCWRMLPSIRGRED